MNARNSINRIAWWPALLAVGFAWFGCAASAETTMTVTGPVVTIGDYISNGDGVLEKRWRYDITNTSAIGAENNMISFQINAGSDNDVLQVSKTYTGSGTINIFIDIASAGFTGLLPPPGGRDNNRISLYFYTPATTPSAPGLAVATAQGVGYAVPFPSVAVDVPAAAPTVDFTEDNGVARYNESTGKYVLDMTVINNMDAEPVANPYNDFVSEIKIEGVYSVTAPTFTSRPPGFGNNNGGYTTIQLTDSYRSLWRMILGTNLAESRIAPGDLKTFLINITLPSGISGSAIRYGNVNAQGKTSVHDYQPYSPPGTFIGPIGVIYPAPVVGLSLAAEQVRMGLGGLVVGREYRVMRSEDLSGWNEVDRFTVVEDPMPASGRVDREWSEAAVLPGRRFYKLEWDEP